MSWRGGRWLHVKLGFAKTKTLVDQPKVHVNSNILRMSTFRICSPARVCLVPRRQPAQSFGRHFTRSLSDRVDGVDRVNPPASTLPAPVNLPTKEDYDSTVKYAWHTGKAYLSFFKTGLKNVWANHKTAREIRRTKGDDLTRADFQLLARSRHDMSRLPIFAIILLLLGEWTPAIAPFMAGVFPKTCRPPKVEEGLLRQAESQREFAMQRLDAAAEPLPERLRIAMRRNGLTILGDWERMIGPGEESAAIVARLSNAYSFEQTSRYDLYTKLMYRLRARTTHWGPTGQATAFWLFGKREQRKWLKHYIYLARDSELIVRDGGPNALSEQEVRIACMERGINVLGKSEAENRRELVRWISDDMKRRQALEREALPEMKQSMDQWMEVQRRLQK